MLNLSAQRVLLVAGLVSVAVATRPTEAATLYLDSVSPTATMNVAFPGTGTVETPYVGGINWTFDRNAVDNAGLGALVAGTTLTTFCIEGTQNVTINETATFAYILTNPGQAPIDNVGSNYVMGANAATLQKFWDAYFSQSFASNEKSAAFQLGVWEIVYDGGESANIGAGNFTSSAVAGNLVSAGALSQAQTWLSGLNAVSPTEHYSLYVLSDAGLQDQLFGVKAAGGTPVPLPAAFPASLVVLAGVGAWKKFRRRA